VSIEEAAPVWVTQEASDDDDAPVNQDAVFCIRATTSLENQFSALKPTMALIRFNATGRICRLDADKADVPKESRESRQSRQSGTSACSS
jgi:hypothetical protein